MKKHRDHDEMLDAMATGRKYDNILEMTPEEIETAEHRTNTGKSQGPVLDPELFAKASEIVMNTAFKREAENKEIMDKYGVRIETGYNFQTGNPTLAVYDREGRNITIDWAKTQGFIEDEENEDEETETEEI